MPRSAIVALSAFGLGVAGCGAADEQGADPRPRPPARALQQPARVDCAAARLATSRQADDRIPKAGTYRYNVAGTHRVVGEPASALHGDMKVTVTAARRVDRLRCFRIRRTFENDISDTATLVVRGSRVYITEMRSILGGLDTHIRPDPPVLALDGDRLSWEYAFSGVTSGRYKAEGIGRRWFQIGGRRVRAVGVHLTLVFTGEVNGTQTSVQWFSPQSHLVIREEVKQRRSFGVDELVLDYRAGARSVRPRT